MSDTRPHRHGVSGNSVTGILRPWAFFLPLFILCFTASAAASEPPIVSDDLRERAVAELRQILEQEERWIKVHAAEALLALDYPQGVRAAFEQELSTHGDEPEYRIGIWRVLARANFNDDKRQEWVHEIRDVFLDPTSPDRLHAVETLAKLGYFFVDDKNADDGRTAFIQAAEGNNAELAVYALWSLAANPTPVALPGQPVVSLQARQNALAEYLESTEDVDRLRAAYCLRHLTELSSDNQTRLRKAVESEPADTDARVYLVSAALITSAVPDRQDIEEVQHLEQLHAEVVALARAGKTEACHALAERGTASDLPLLTELLDHDDADARVAAAGAILRIGRRGVRSLTALDWGVTIAYGLALIGVGWYWSRRTATAEEYLLGGRAMSPWTVGLSLFATLLSTLSYLSVPGEMIHHGPMLITQLLAYPFIIGVVGWVLIPIIMRHEVTSAYEILEKRLGVSVRLLGSLFFLSLRLLWMAAIIYATTNEVLVPLLGWDPWTIPYTCAVLGMITVIYTSMGGLRAVVVTDVVQTLVLFAGAGLALALITADLGGVAAWWPTTWLESWDPFKIWFEPGSRRTVAAYFVSAFTWYVCTSGSDQMAIQRYLATRDVHAARRMFIISMVVGAVVTVFLVLLGMALLAFFQTHPEMLADGQTIESGADGLLPRFIAHSLPAGISGLVVAALLAAAMSSLSSGVNSSCSVITVDLIDRFRGPRSAETDHLRRAKYVSWLVGAVVVAISLFASVVSGNLFEVTHKVVNLFVAPLFVLFFMALFVPWATSFGTLLAAIASVAVAVAISFYSWLGIGFLWSMPSSLLAGILVGMLASLVPIGPRKTPIPDP